MAAEDIDFIKIGQVFDYFIPILQAEIQQAEEQKAEEVRQYSVVRDYCQSPAIQKIVAKLNGG